ncbi:MAG: hypothetical protein R8P61_32265 [Bacteroidia bacterium]|nr:hypothetical protein [Bacteroidia bacterium]
MPLHSLTEDELRSITRRKIESLERWFRRLIDTRFSSTYGQDYFNATNPDGSNIINNQIKRRAEELHSREPGRCPRLIDALFLDDLMTIICHPNYWPTQFREPMILAFPNGADTARIFIQKIIDVRNPLSHANHISVRQAEQAICYSNDIIDSIKNWHQNNHQMSDYNAPYFIRLFDSLGNEQHFTEPTGGGSIQGSTSTKLYVGETLTINAEVDPSFEPDSYAIIWSGNGISGTGNQLVLELENRHVGRYLVIRVLLRSNKDWHRYNHNSSDSYCAISYEVLPNES